MGQENAHKAIALFIAFVALVGAIVISMHSRQLETIAKTLTHEFRSPAFGYSLMFPEDWILDASRAVYPVDYLQNPSGTVRIFIDVSDDPATSDPKSRKVMVDNIKLQFEMNPRYDLTSFSDTTFKRVPAFIMTGWRDDQNDNSRWYFKQYVIFLQSSGRLYNVTASIRSDALRKNKRLTDMVIDTLVMPVPKSAK